MKVTKELHDIYGVRRGKQAKRKKKDYRIKQKLTITESKGRSYAWDYVLLGRNITLW